MQNKNPAEKEGTNGLADTLAKSSLSVSRFTGTLASLAVRSDGKSADMNTKLMAKFQVKFASVAQFYFAYHPERDIELCVEPCFSGFYAAMYDPSGNLVEPKREIFASIPVFDFNVMVSAASRGVVLMCNTHRELLPKAVEEAWAMYQTYKTMRV